MTALKSTLYWITIVKFAGWFLLAVMLVLPILDPENTESRSFLLTTWVMGILCFSLTILPICRRLQLAVDEFATNTPNNRTRFVFQADEIGTLRSLAVDWRQANEELTEQILNNNRDEQLAAMMAAMAEGVIAIDNTERIEFANATACRLLELDEETVIGRLLFESVRNSSLVDTVRDTLANGQAGSVEFRYSRSDSYLSIDVAPMESGGLVLTIDDVSELRRLERTRRDFVSAVSHELKTPLTVIQACTETLIGGALHDFEDAVRFLKRIELQSDRLQELIIGMLHLARLEAGQEVFNTEVVDLAELSRQTASAMLPVAEAKHISLTVHGPDELFVLADRQAIRTVLDNLIDNALKYTPTQGRIDIHLSEQEKTNRLEVTDSGIGIAPEDVDRVFERFYRVNRDRDRETGGTGLGLAIAKHLCQSIGADIHVTSEAGVGACFVVEFPLDIQTDATDG